MINFMFSLWDHPVLCVSLLYLTVLLLWYPKTFPRISIPLWFISAIIFIFISFLKHQLTYQSIIPIVLLIGITYKLGQKKLSTQSRIAFGLTLFCLAALLGLIVHALPGFHNIRVLNHLMITEDAVPLTMYWNFDKTLVGIFILGFMTPLIHTWSEVQIIFKKALLPVTLTILAVVFLAFQLKFIHFSPKLSSHIFVWATTNLLFICTAEEAFFRGFVQRYLCLWFTRVKGGDLIAIAIASLLFGVSHYHGSSLKYMALATMAGMGYGFVYWRTKSIEASIITHFSLNTIHFLFFTYPALMSSFR